MMINYVHLLQISFLSTFYADPLEQFEAFRLADLPLIRWFTNVALSMCCVCVIWLYLTVFHANILKDAYDFVMSISFGLVKSIIKENLPLDRQQYFVPFYFLFGFIFFINLFGLIPFSFTPTSCISVTFFISATHYIGINFLAV
jgi:F0F1-type ATP synthase membrane subunit a